MVREPPVAVAAARAGAAAWRRVAGWRSPGRRGGVAARFIGVRCFDARAAGSSRGRVRRAAPEAVAGVAAGVVAFGVAAGAAAGVLGECVGGVAGAPGDVSRSGGTGALLQSSCIGCLLQRFAHRL